LRPKRPDYSVAGGSLQAEKAVKDLVRRSLDETSEWKTATRAIAAAVPPRKALRLRIRGSKRAAPFPIEVPKLSEDRLRGATFRVGERPNAPWPKGAALLTSLELGYLRDDGFRSAVPIAYLLVARDGAVLEVGAGSKEALRAIRETLFGRTLSVSELARMDELNRRLLARLREEPATRAKLDAFAKARKWKSGTAEAGGLAYYDAESFDLKAWAKENGYTNREMHDAGWYRLQFDARGEARYRPEHIDGIRIPYFAGSDGKSIPIWRTRNTGKQFPNLPKYLAWPLNRAIDRDFGVAERLYQSGLLAKARGKTVVITEGEFKCLVATREAGVITVGIPGITQFDADLAKSLVDSGASEFVVILDRDPKGKALLRSDGVSDSERAAYQIAKELEAAGAAKVRVGTLPTGPVGEKLGIDDLVLSQGPKPYLETIAGAIPSADYAKKLGLDESFMELARRRSSVRKALEKVSAYQERETLSPELLATVSKLRKMVTVLNEGYSAFLDFEFGGAVSLNQADARFGSIGRVSQIPGLAKKKFTSVGVEPLPLSVFSDELLILDYAAAGVKTEACFPLPCGGLPYSTKELRAAFDTGQPTGSLASDYEQGAALAAASDFVAKDFRDFVAVVSAGRVADAFPLDDYRYFFGAAFVDGAGKRVGVPVAVVKKDGSKAVALVRAFTDAKEAEGSREQFKDWYRFLREP
jgi:hypothetical protein